MCDFILLTVQNVFEHCSFLSYADNSSSWDSYQSGESKADIFYYYYYHYF